MRASVAAVLRGGSMRIPEDIARAIVDPKAYAERAQSDAAFRWLRREAPLEIAEPEGYTRFWAVTRHADILAISRRNDLFGNSERSVVLTTTKADARVRSWMGGSPHLLRSLVQMDGKDHQSYRRLTQAWFAPQNLARLESRVRTLARQAVDRIADQGGTCDFARDVALLYPLHVIMEILGVPSCDEPRMLKLTQQLFASIDPELNRSQRRISGVDDGLRDIQAAIFDFMTYFDAMTTARRNAPTHDLASAIANGTIEGEALGQLEAMSYYILVATAGHDTTASTLAGGLWALAENPNAWRRIQADRTLIPSLVEEATRWESPVKHFMRCALADVEIQGRKIAKGDWLMLAYPSGNRDEAVFEAPDTFDLGRSPNRHLSYGYGAHACLGQHLARLEMRVFWEEFIPRVTRVELDGQPLRTEANFVCGPKTLPVRLQMR